MSTFAIRSAAFAMLVVWLAICVYMSSTSDQSGSDSPPTQVSSPADGKNVVESAGGEQATRTVHEVWQYYLSTIIAVLTGLGSIVLILRSTRPSNHPDMALISLYMIAVALIVEAVLICCVLRVDVKQYEAIYAAIAGYVLGSLGRRAGGLELKTARQV